MTSCELTPGPLEVSLPAGLEDQVEPSAAAQRTAEEIQEWVADAAWSFASRGLDEPETVEIVDGTATDQYDRIYEVGEGAPSDANGDGITDLAVPISVLDGNGFEELWYIWLGSDDPDTVATQVLYPIALSTRCGDVIHSVTASDGGFAIDQTLRMPSDHARDCASGGTGHQQREVAVVDIDGHAYPLQTAPVEAWGGICPRSEWLDGLSAAGADIRTAPPASARAIEVDDSTYVYELPEAPLLTADGARFFGFTSSATMVEEPSTPDFSPVVMHCAFAG